MEPQVEHIGTGASLLYGPGAPTALMVAIVVVVAIVVKAPQVMPKVIELLPPPEELLIWEPTLDS